MGAIGIGAIVHSLKNDMENSDSRSNAANNGQKYYTDNHGKIRRVDNNHQVLRHATGGTKYNWDTVDKDMETGQILHNYTQEKRDEIFAEKREIQRENEKKKQEAIKQGLYWYSVKEPPIEGYARRGDIRYYEYQQRLKSVHGSEDLSRYESHNYRVSDGLLLQRDISHYDSHPIKDFKYGLIVFESISERVGDLRKIKDHANWNREYCGYEWVHRNYNITEEQLLNYARKIGAYLPETMEEKETECKKSIEDTIEQIKQTIGTDGYNTVYKFLYDNYVKYYDVMFWNSRLSEMKSELKFRGYELDKDAIIMLLRKARINYRKKNGMEV